MKKFFFLLFIAAAAPTWGQDYTDLLELLVDEKYEKLLLKAEKYTLADDSRKDALPYLYMSLGYYSIHLKDDDPDLQERYPKAFKESLKYAVKHRKKDKTNQYYEEYIEHFDALRTVAISDANQYNSEEKYTKSKGIYKNLTKMDLQDVGAWIFKGCTEYMGKSLREADLSWQEAKKLAEEGAADHLTEVQKDLLKQSLIYCAEMLDGNGNTTDARDWLEFGLTWFEQDEEFMVTYEMIAG